MLCYYNHTYYTIFIWYFYNTKDGRESITSADIRSYEAFKTMILYPISMGICWLPVVCYRFYSLIQPSTVLNLNITFLIAPMYGLFLAVIFYWKTSAARQEWMILYQQIRSYCSNNDQSTDEQSNDEQSRDSIALEMTENIIHDNIIHDNKNHENRILRIEINGKVEFTSSKNTSTSLSDLTCNGFPS